MMMAWRSNEMLVAVRNAFTMSASVIEPKSRPLDPARAATVTVTGFDHAALSLSGGAALCVAQVASLTHRGSLHLHGVVGLEASAGRQEEVAGVARLHLDDVASSPHATDV